ncbi:hypothetical protein MMC18_005855, partial [Xylographa bjoerkii]|nr:hypothetical protein [Xylographa bjoerkii]
TSSVRIGSTGSTGLQIAITHGRTDMVDLLIEYDADTEAKDNAGQTAFDIARRSIKSNKITVGAHAIIMRALSETMDINIPSDTDSCAIVTAVRNSDYFVVAYLLKDQDMIELLSKHGALNELPNSSFNAVEFAESINHQGIENFLRESPQNG